MPNLVKHSVRICILTWRNILIKKLSKTVFWNLKRINKIRIRTVKTVNKTNMMMNWIVILRVRVPMIAN